MKDSINVSVNTVPSKDQLSSSRYVKTVISDNEKLRVLFVGNSITLHSPKADIGWSGNWGMAASCLENDYVHQTVSMLSEKLGGISYCIAQLATWERDYTNSDSIMEEYYTAAKAFAADVVVIRLGENVPLALNEGTPIKPYLEKMITFLSENNRDAKVVITDNFWKRPALDIQLYELAKEKGFIFVSIGDLENDKRTMALGEYEHRGVSIHPSDFGMEKIAARIVGALMA